jgi:hypothetical protein
VKFSSYVAIFLFAISLPISAHAQYPCFETTLHWGHEAKDKKNLSWNNSQIHSSHNYQPYFHRYNLQDFRDYCTKHGYSEKEILNQRCLYMYDEFVKFAQTHSDYPSTIKQLHAELKHLTHL